MTSICGTITGLPKTSHLYAVFKGPYAYFGETGNVPPARWQAHLLSGRDFLGKLSREDVYVAKGSAPMLFIGIHIKQADRERKTSPKIARRAVEAELHSLFLRNNSLMPSNIKLLSIAPISPVKHKLSFKENEVALEIYKMIAHEYRNWRVKLYKSDGTRTNLRTIVSV